MKSKCLPILIMVLILFSCTKEVTPVLQSPSCKVIGLASSERKTLFTDLEWDTSSSETVNGFMTDIKMTLMVSKTDATRHLVKIDGGITTIVTVTGDSMVFADENENNINITRQPTDTVFQPKLVSCQSTMRQLCLKNTVCSVAYTLSWWILEYEFYWYCRGKTHKGNVIPLDSVIIDRKSVQKNDSLILIK